MKMSSAATTSYLTGLLILLVATQCLGQDCSFHPECRPGELYRLAIPCQGKCEYYIECSDGVPSEKKCGKFLWHQNQFDPERLDCLRNTNCDWWKALTTTTTSTTSTSTTASSTTVLPTSTVPPTPSPSTPATPPDTTTSAALNTTITEATTSVAPPTEPSTSTSTPTSSTPATAGAPHLLAPLVAATGLALLVVLR